MCTTPKKNRSWCFTLNNPEIEPTLPDGARYLCYGRELAPTTGTPHLQGFIMFHHAVAFSRVKNFLPTANWSERYENSSDIRAAIYAKKKGDFVEYGDPPVSQKRKGEMNAERWEKSWELAKKGKIEEIDGDLRTRYLRTYERVADKYGEKPVSRPLTDNWWFVGKTGKGKSKTARDENPGAYIKSCTKWWDHYNGESCVIIDEVELGDYHLSRDLKIWTDHYPFNAEYKGGSRMIRPERIIVTSQYDIDQIFADGEVREALKRRFRIRRFE